MSAYSITTRGLPQGTLTPMGALLFAASEPGAWYDPSDLSTLFQDSAGTTPVTAVEQQVGRMLDKSGRGNHATQVTATKRPVYSRRVNWLVSTETLSTQSVTTLAAKYVLSFWGTGSISLTGTVTATLAGTGTNDRVYTQITCSAGSLNLTVSGSVLKAQLELSL